MWGIRFEKRGNLSITKGGKGIATERQNGILCAQRKKERGVQSSPYDVLKVVKDCTKDPREGGHIHSKSSYCTKGSLKRTENAKLLSY